MSLSFRCLAGLGLILITVFCLWLPFPGHLAFQGVLLVFVYTFDDSSLDSVWNETNGSPQKVLLLALLLCTFCCTFTVALYVFIYYALEF